MAKHRPGARYFAGLWSDLLTTDLLWVAPFATKAKPWRAPSWSWAVWNGTIKYPRSTFVDHSPQPIPRLFTLHGLSIIPATADPTGKLSAASMTVSGQLTDAFCCFSSTRFSYIFDDTTHHLSYRVNVSVKASAGCPCSPINIGLLVRSA